MAFDENYTVNNDPRLRAVESLGRTGKKLAGSTLQMGVQATRAMQNALYPNEFEYYALTIELIDSKNQSIQWLTFPVMPESIVYDDQIVVNIQKTVGGVVATDSPSYTPKTISISGSFGRKFRIMVNPKDTAIGPADNTRSFGGAQKKIEFDPYLKTGFGATKLLQQIMDLSSSVDETGEPYRLLLYLPPLGQNFLVKKTQFQLSQDQQSSNMMWRYSIILTAIAPLESVLSQEAIDRSLRKTMTVDLLQKGATQAASIIVNSARQLLGTTPGNQ